MSLTKAMIVSVGGSPEPVVFSLNQRQPEYILYFTSIASRKMVRESIEPHLLFKPADHEIVMTPDEEDLGVSVAELLHKVPQFLQVWNVPFRELLGDYTGGTKTMSAALVLALAERGCSYSYVGGKSRNKEGLGTVLNGHERSLYLDNPWDVLAVGPCRDAELLFNRARFRAVSDLAERTATRTECHRPFFEALRHLSQGYYAWDAFQYKAALSDIKRGESQLRNYAAASHQNGVKQFLQAVQSNLPLLEQIQNEVASLAKRTKSKKEATVNSAEAPAQHSLLVADLVANAKRRAELEYKYDDAVARLYSAIEKLAKYRLLTAYEIDNSAVDLTLVPAELHQGLRECANPRENGKIQIPLFRSYELLAALRDPLGIAYMANETELRKVLGVRNTSLLAHGFDPVTQSTYRDLLTIACLFLELAEDQLPSFPRLDFAGKGL